MGRYDTAKPAPVDACEVGYEAVRTYLRSVNRDAWFNAAVWRAVHAYADAVDSAAASLLTTGEE